MNNNSEEQAAFNALMREDFRSFVAKVFSTLNEGQKYCPNWHIDLICDKLTDCAKGRNKRLIINMPPRSLKSICTSVALPAWIMGLDPTKRVMCISYGEDLADKHALDCLKILRSKWYMEAFPETRLSHSKSAVSDFKLTRGGGRISDSVRGAITGRGAEIVIIDDPLKADDTNFDNALNKVNQWYDLNIYQRLDTKKEGVIILVMQRLHENDLTGYLLNDSSFHHLALPAIAEDDEVHKFHDGRCVRRSKGEALHEEHEPLELLVEVRQRIGKFIFAGQYQQSPAPAEGGIVKAEWLPRYDSSKINSKTEFDYTVQSWDTAYTTKKYSDYSVGITIGVLDGKFYILDIYREKLEFPDLRRAVHLKACHYKTETILVEDAAEGARLVRALEGEDHSMEADPSVEVDTSIEVVLVKPLHDKLARLSLHTARLEGGQVLLPQSAHWIEDFVHELTTFPGAKNDDQVDALSQALDHLSSQKPFEELAFIFPGDEGPEGDGDTYIEAGMIWTKRE